MNAVEAAQIVNEWLQSVSSDGEVRLDDNLTCMLQAEGGADVILELSPDGSSLSFYSPLLAIPQHHRAEAYQFALSLNLYQAMTRDAVIAYDVASDSLALTYKIELANGLEVEDGHLMDNFTETADSVRQMMHEFLTTSTDTSSPAKEDMQSDAAIFRA